jgi:hypothetical protein
METAYVSAFSALAGTVIGGFTSLVASWLTQRVQIGAEERAHDVTVREALYKEFIEEASKAYADAFEHSEVDVPEVVRLYTVVNRMRILSSQRVVQQADKVMQLIIETYRAPNRTIRDEAERIKAGGLDPLLGFSEACRDELRSRARRRSGAS